MVAFQDSNPRLRTRHAHHVACTDLTTPELRAIAELLGREQEYELDDASRAALHEHLTLRVGPPRLGNVRSVRNAIDRAMVRPANRLVRTPVPVSMREASRVDADDLRGRWVFAIAPAPVALVPTAVDRAPTPR